jgi:hypothetical protein
MKEDQTSTTQEQTGNTNDKSTASTGADRASANTQVTKLLHLVDHHGELFHTPTMEPFASCKVEGHYEHYSLRSAAFKMWLSRQFFLAHRSVATPQALDAALNLLGAKACFEGPEHEMHVRIAEHDGDIYVDLCDKDWQVVRVSPTGYTVFKKSPVKFRRPKGAKSLPVPQPGGSIDELRPFVNVRDEHQWKLLVGFVLAAFRPTGPYPLLEVIGGHGSAKSMMTKVLRDLIDPNAATMRSLGTLEELALAAHNGWLLTFDNLSRLPKAMSDALCRMSTGGASSKRKLYADDEETLFEAKRPVVVNGIGGVVTESDLFDRTVVLDLPEIRSAKRRDEEQFWNEFNSVRPRVFGAILTGVAGALTNIHAVPSRMDWPRLADFAKFATAAESQFGWTPGAFMEAYNANREELNARVIDDDKLAIQIIALANAKTAWSGTATELLGVVNPEGEPGLPKAANSLKQRLIELKPNLDAAGIEVEFARQGSTSQKMIYIRKRMKAAA